MKNYVGRKIRGFRFEDGTDGVGFHLFMNDCIGKLGEITHECECCVTVNFANVSWHYPNSLIEPHLIEEETPEIINLTNVKGVEMMVSQDEKDWFKAKVIAKVVDAYIDNQGNVWYYAKPIQQLPKYTHTELVEIVGHDFEYINK
jgi:hypothetical protein